MHVSSSTKSIHIPSPLAANIEEIARHIDDLHDRELDAPRNAALRMFANDHINQYADQFEQKDDDLYIYTGGNDD